MVLVVGLKSKSCVGLLKMPPKVIESPPAVAVAGAFSVTWLVESTLTMYAPGGIPLPATDQYTCSSTVEERPVITGEPFVVFPATVTGDGPASAAKITCPFGNAAAGASSAPNGADLPVGFALLLSVPKMSGPA